MDVAVIVELDKPSTSKNQAALNVKDALQEEGDYDSDVYEHTEGTVIVVVHEPRDAEEEITNKLNDAGVSCMVSEALKEQYPDEWETPVTLPELEH